MNNNFVKGLIMTLVAFIASVISASGIPDTPIEWQILLISSIGTVLVYLAKNFVFPSISVFGKVDLRDALSGIILALGTGISNWVATILTDTPIDWSSLWTMVVSVVIGYFTKNLFTPKQQ